MEIVFEPQLFDGDEAAALVKELALILQVNVGDIDPWLNVLYII